MARRRDPVVSVELSFRIGAALLLWYEQHAGDRQLPWRDPDCGPAVSLLVEGLLIRTRAEQVARDLDQVFPSSVRDADDPAHGARAWLQVPSDERLRRVSLHGIGLTKQASCDRIARVLADGDLDQLRPTVFCEGMVLLRYGLSAVPVDANVRRVARCCAGLDSHESVVTWVGSLLRSVGMPSDRAVVTGVWSRDPPPAYRLLSALLDVGARCRTARAIDCALCPLRRWCRLTENI